ncbi:glycoside hydrolase family 2 [Massilia forsythiae]|uniref:Glycoside hydrolase family 2 n=1 Tax=Massilia forsythiae TaxID=2728020 RepID=A0A7Z2ZRT9_9BURK|nr:sialate O-acetylesterase [Massilia forsythiae]QJD99543.1 glycoside hydrolase family 2 [Massilia forsythiae]
MTHTRLAGIRLFSIEAGALAVVAGIGAWTPAQAAQATQATAPAFARVFGEHAVLQRGEPIEVWGTAGAGSKLTLSLNGRSAAGTADAHGKWRIRLPRMAAGGPYTLSVSSGSGQTASLGDIMVGDVYLCSGQSNMEFAVRNSTNAWSNTNAAGNPNLRFLNVEKLSSPTPQDELKQPAAWKVASPETIGDASAVCYYMARSLQGRYKVPVGFINASWGGTTIQGWIGATSLRTLPAHAAGVDAVAKLAADPAAAMKDEEARIEAWWDAHDPAARTQRAWNAPGHDDAAWRSITPAGSWKDSGAADLAGFDGVAWFRTEVTLTQAQAEQADALQLGPVDTYDTTWVNGVRVGGGSTGWMWRDYPVPKGVFKAGRNLVAVRVLGGGQGGGLTGQPDKRGVRTADGQFIALPPSWKYRTGTRLAGLSVPAAPWDVPTSLSTLYNGMIAPLAGYKFKLAAWYQGESNALAADEYRSLLPLLMRDWRTRFGQPALPFLVVQLTSFGAPAKAPGPSAWAELREAQAAAVREDRHAALAVTLDVGDRTDIHPTQKTIVGERLARAARALAYGDATAPGGPEALSARRSGADIVVAFRNVHGALATYSSDKALGFETCAGSVCRYADAGVAGERVVLKGANTAGVTSVRYAWADAPIVNLFDGDDLPAAPFQLSVE